MSQMDGRGGVPCELFDFAYCAHSDRNNPDANRSYADYLSGLASMADPEYWGEDNRILFNYVKHLFKKISRDYNEGDGASDSFYISESLACFNTGLYTCRYEDIYCLFAPNRRAGAQPWYLSGFYKASANELQEMEYLPERPRLYDDPADLIFDYRLQIRANKDHILGDPQNISRLPVELQDPAKRPQLHRLLDGGILEAQKRVAANYTLAVPQFYNGKIQLLVPLCLTDDHPQLALAIQKSKGFYAARTCLTIDMAYNNARLIVKPEAQWIMPNSC